MARQRYRDPFEIGKEVATLHFRYGVRDIWFYRRPVLSPDAAQHEARGAYLDQVAGPQDAGALGRAICAELSDAGSAAATGFNSIGFFFNAGTQAAVACADAPAPDIEYAAAYRRAGQRYRAPLHA